MGLDVRDVAAAPGTDVPLVATMRNELDRALAYEVRVVGLDDAWVSPAARTDVLEPGAGASVTFVVRLPLGFPAAEQLLGVVATPLDGSHPPLHTQARLVVGDGGDIVATLEPADLRGAEDAEFDLVLRNQGVVPAVVELEGASPAGRLRVELPAEPLRVEPGTTLRVRGRVGGRRPVAGGGRRLPFVVSARGPSTPVHVEGSLNQRPVLSGGLLRLVAIIALLGLWVGALGAGINTLTDTEDESPLAAADQQADDGDGDGGADGDGGGDGDGGAGEDADGAGGSDAGGVKVGGTVEAADPAGVTVRIQPVSLVDEEAQGASFQQGLSEPRMSKQSASPGQALPRQVSEVQSTTTDDSGAWAFGSVRAPGYHLVTFSKAGYGTRSYVIETSDAGEPVQLDAILTAGAGGISGVVVDSSGAPLGGVDITVSDGEVELATRTPTDGQGVGSFSVAGLTTPGTFTVTAERRGFGTELALVELGGSASSDVRLTMSSGVGSITGNVTAAGLPLLDAEITVTGDDIERTASALTEGSPGTYSLPQLPIPATYSLTVEAEGHQPTTQEVTLTGNERVDVELRSTTATVYGTLTDNTGAAVTGAGVTIANEQVTLKDTSVGDPPGSYRLTGVPPGTYVLTFTSFDHDPVGVEITVGAGDLRQQDAVMTVRDPDIVPTGSAVVGQVLDNRTSEPVAGVVVTAGGRSTTTDENGDYTIGDLEPGIVDLRFEATGYNPSTGRAILPVTPEGAPPSIDRVDIRLVPLSSLRGRILSRDGNVAPEAAAVLVRTDGDDATPVPLEVDPETGQFAIEQALEAGSYRIDASAPNHRPASRTVQLQAGQDLDVGDILLDRLGILEVQVRTVSGTGQFAPVDDATVTATGPDGEVVSGPVDENGDAVLEGLEPGLYEVVADSESLGESDTRTVDVQLNQRQIVRAIVINDGGPYTGTVQFQSPTGNQFVPGATVRVEGFGVSSNGESIVAVSGTYTTSASGSGDPFAAPAGMFTIPLTSEDASVTTSDEFASPEVTITVTASGFQQTTVRRTLPTPAGDLEPIVIGANPGQIVGSFAYDPSTPVDPPAGAVSALVTPPNASGPSSAFTITVDGGTYRIFNNGSPDIPIGTYTIVLTRPGFFDSAPVTVTVSPGQTATAPSTTLVQQGRLTIQATSSSGGPIAATYTISAIGEPAFTQTVTTGGTGPARFTGLPRNRTFQVTISAPRHATQTFSDGSLSTTGVSTGTVSYQLQRQAGVSGRVTIAGGTAAVNGASVTLTRSSDGATATVSTGSDGTYSITSIDGSDGLAPGTYTIQATATGYQPSATQTLELSGADQTANFSLVAEPATLGGTITFPSTAPTPEDVTVTATRGSDVFTATVVAGDPDTTLDYSFAPLAAGTYTVRFTAPEVSPLERIVTLDPGSDVDLDVSLTSNLGTISGTVVANYGTTSRPALAEATVTLTGGPGSPRTTTTNGDGGYSFDQIRPGTSYTVAVSATGFTSPPPTPVTTTTPAGATTVSPITLTAETRPVVVTATSTAGDGVVPVGTVTLTPTSPGRPTIGPTALSGGSATLPNVPPGSYTLASTAPTTGPPRGTDSGVVVMVPSDGESSPVEAELEMEEGILSVAVLQRDSNAPAAASSQASITVTQGSRSFTLTPSASGPVTQPLALGTYSVSTVHDSPADYIADPAGAQSATISSGETETVSTTFTRRGTINVVVSGTGEATSLTLNGASVDEGAQERRAPGSYTLAATNSDGPQAGDDTEDTGTLEPGGVLTLTVVINAAPPPTTTTTTVPPTTAPPTTSPPTTTG